MKMKILYSKITAILSVALVAVLIASCGDFKKSSVVAPPSTGGKVDFTRYFSIGNSLTAGYENGALYESAQQYSYPNLIAQQASLAMGTNVVFNQPLISDPGFGVLDNTPIGRLQIVDLSKTPPTIAPASSASPVPINATLSQPYNNLGVPGAILSDMMDTTSLSNPNPYFGIVLRNPALGKSCVKQALAMHPTFMTVEIGDNDILGYATRGGVTPYNPPAYFQAEYTALMDTLMADAPTAKFAIANIPDVTTIPFVTTVPDSFANPATGVNIGAFIVQRHHDDPNTLYSEPIHAKTDYILLSAIDLLNAGVGVPAPFGTGRPLPDQFVLDSLEVATAKGIISQYNNIIKDIANAHPDRIALVDVNAFLSGVAQHGYVADGMEFTSSFITGGLFGLDGVHPTAQGYGILANQFIMAINSRFGSNLPLVSIPSIPGTIVLAKSTAQPNILPKIHYNYLKPVLQLFGGDRSY
jgi:lysophospholipase L1-like esterase